MPLFPLRPFAPPPDGPARSRVAARVGFAVTVEIDLSSRARDCLLGVGIAGAVLLAAAGLTAGAAGSMRAVGASRAPWPARWPTTWAGPASAVPVRLPGARRAWGEIRARIGARYGWVPA